MASPKKLPIPTCAACQVELSKRLCQTEKGQPGKNCPTAYDDPSFDKATRQLAEPETREFARQASLQEAACYAGRGTDPYILQPTKTRIVEIMEFAERMGYRRLGLAFCVGLAREAAIVNDILTERGFEVASAMCKAGGALKSDIGLKREDQIRQAGPETMCNPVYQAELMNRSETELNILLGLCVGHDSLFMDQCQAPCTVLAVKDRVTGHNPLAAIYLSESYYRKVKHPDLC